MTTATYSVIGMTCQQCVNAVSTELSKLPDVTEVAVELETGMVTVTSRMPVDVAAVRSAVDEAGYELVV